MGREARTTWNRRSCRAHLTRAGAALFVGLASLSVAACGDLVPPTEAWPVEAWVCHVPADTTSPWYMGLPARREVSAEWFSDRVAARVPTYVETVSGGRLRLDIATGGELTLAADEGAEECIDRVVAEVAESTKAVVVIADAEHAEGKPGGLGGALARDSSVSAGPRGVGYAYVGAADVAPTWGDDPPMDLVEHELGHALGWLHSGSSTDAYDSALDVMSDSAAPRSVDPMRRDAQWPIAVHLVASGWVEADEVLWVDPVPGGSTSAVLVPLSSQGGRRVVVLPVPGRDDVVLTIERREPVGYDSHLAPGGLAVHRVEFGTGSPGAADPSSIDWSAVVSIVPLVGSSPFADLLVAGESLDADGWTIVAGDGGQVTVGLVSGT